jgi:hypothetical protein
MGAAHIWGNNKRKKPMMTKKRRARLEPGAKSSRP